MNPVIRDAALREVVGTDLSRPVAGSDLGAAHASALGLLLRDTHVEQARPQHLHRLEAVLDLRALVLLADDQTGREVCDADGGVGGVDSLPAGPGGPEDVDPEILLVD